MIRNLVSSDIDDIRHLAHLASAEGFQFLDRFVSELQQDSVALDSPREFFLGFVVHGDLVGMGGVTPDPYVQDAQTGRVRHLYVRPDHRRESVGRDLLHELESRAFMTYSILRLRTDTIAAARFYEALGYRPVDDATATHVRYAAVANPSSG